MRVELLNLSAGGSSSYSSRMARVHSWLAHCTTQGAPPLRNFSPLGTGLLQHRHCSLLEPGAAVRTVSARKERCLQRPPELQGFSGDAA